MPRILIGASLFVVAVFGGILMGQTLSPKPRLAHAKQFFKKPGSMNRRRPRWSGPGGAAVWRIVKDIDDGSDTQHDYVRALAVNC
jgi:hypothetical protein